MVSLFPVTGLALITSAALSTPLSPQDTRSPMHENLLKPVMYDAKRMCDAPATKINIIPQAKPVKYDFSQSYAQIQQKKTDTINPYGHNSITHTNGYMQGGISLGSQVKLGHKALPRNDNNCLWYEQIDIKITIDPTIVIAKEVAADKCMFNAVKTHELNHVRVDRLIVNKYAKIFSKKLYSALKQRGFVAARIRSEQVEVTATRMRETVNQILELEIKKMEIERMENQQAIDNLEEYKAVQAKCPDFRPPSQTRKAR